MKKISLQWRLTLMTSLLIAISCIVLNLLLYRTGSFYMESLGDSVQDYGISFALPKVQDPDNLYIDIPENNWDDFVSQFSIQVVDTKRGYGIYGWLITAVITLLSGFLTYFISGQALKPLRAFSRQVAQVQFQNITDCSVTPNGVPEFRQLCQSFNQMLERLSAAFQSQRQFTGNAAHEFRTPLALMQAKLDLYSSAPHPGTDPETAETLTMMQEQVERLSKLVKTLLDMSELQTIQRKDHVALIPLMDEVLTDLMPLADSRNITLVQQTSENPASSDHLCVTGSDILLYRLFFNLIENGVKYNRENGSVKIDISKEQNFAIIKISDTGNGISKEYLESIFQPFFRVDKSRSRALGGVGLGLALVREIALLHGGNVSVASSSNAGSTFEVRLPLSQS